MDTPCVKSQKRTEPQQHPNETRIGSFPQKKRIAQRSIISTRLAFHRTSYFSSLKTAWTGRPPGHHRHLWSPHQRGIARKTFHGAVADTNLVGLSEKQRSDRFSTATETAESNQHNKTPPRKINQFIRCCYPYCKVVCTRSRSPPHKRFFVWCSPPFM